MRPCFLVWLFVFVVGGGLVAFRNLTDPDPENHHPPAIIFVLALWPVVFFAGLVAWVLTEVFDV